ncbi:NACHT domain-containing protein [Streptomyces sp. NPDC002602]|uniref:NACHT domain-containing protein n=1 Tax=Streptomyces sp. NPDC002602 TaxID=3364654 RepID=UPI00367F4238
MRGTRRRRQRGGMGWIITGLLLLMGYLGRETAAGLLPDLFKAGFGDKPLQVAIGVLVAFVVAGCAMYIPYRRSRTEAGDEASEVTAVALERARNVLLHRVDQMWTRDLDHRWNDIVRIELGLEDSPAAVDDPWASAALVTRSGTPLPPGTTISAMYERHGSQLLVLGAPGAGKTIHMLELTRALVERAKAESGAPVPVFLLLTNWRGERMVDWIEEELRRRYRVPSEVAGSLLSQGAIDVILDGLDEVDPSRHARCVTELNTFLSADGLPQCGIAISCRTLEYDVLPQRLTVNGAIAVQPLPVAVVHAFLNDAGPQLDGLRGVAAVDPELTRLLTTPLMLGIAAVAYSGVDGSAVLSIGSLGERRALVYDAFLEKMVTRDRTLSGRNGATRYDVDEVSRRLMRMAADMAQFHATVIYPRDPMRMALQAPSHVLREMYGGTALGYGAFPLVALVRWLTYTRWSPYAAVWRVFGATFARSLPYVRPDFIAFCSERALLRRSGDGLAFIHKTFQDHLAERFAHRDRPGSGSGTQGPAPSRSGATG